MKISRHCLPALIAAGLLACASAATAQIIQPSTEATSKETKAYGHQPSSALNSNIAVTTPAAGAHFVSLVQFDLSSINAANADAIINAYLRLYSPLVAAGGTVTISPMLTDWREEDAAPGTAPVATYDALFGFTFEGEPVAPTLSWGPAIASVEILTSGFYEWDVTNIVKSWYSSSTANYGFMIQATGAGAVNITLADVDSHPGVAGSAPALVVVPEPSSTIALLGGVGLLCLFRRRSPRIAT
jgi:hypothetical protein